MMSQNGSGYTWVTQQCREKLFISFASTIMKKSTSWMPIISYLINFLSIQVHANSIMDSMDKLEMSLQLSDQVLIEPEDMTNYTENLLLNKYYPMLTLPMVDLKNSMKQMLHLILLKLLLSTPSLSISDGITIIITESISILLEENGWVWPVFQKPEITLEPHGDNVPQLFGIGIGTVEELTISQPITGLMILTEMNNWTTTIFKNSIILGISSTMDIPRLSKEIMPSLDLAEPAEYQRLTSPI